MFLRGIIDMPRGALFLRGIMKPPGGCPRTLRDYADAQVLPNFCVGLCSHLGFPVFP